MSVISRTGQGRDMEVLSKLERLEADLLQKLTMLDRVDLSHDKAGLELEALLRALRGIVEHKVREKFLVVGF